MPYLLSKPVHCWLTLLLLYGAQQSAAAQTTASTTKQSSLQLPQLPEGGGSQAIVRAIQQRVVYPRLALRNGVQGQALVTFAVAPDGRVGRVSITRSLRADLDTAVVFAVRELPQMQPARQHGKPVACLFSAPVTFVLTDPLITSSTPIPRADSTQLYTVLEQMPQYKGSAGYQQLGADLGAEYLRLLKGTSCFIPRTNLSALLTISPSGFISDVQIHRHSTREVDALLATYGDAVAIQEESELPASCVALLAQAAKRLPRLTPGYANGAYVATRLQIVILSPAP